MSKVHTYLQHEALFRGQAALLARKDVKILLCGGGALGSFLCDLLARQGYWGLAVLDMDKVDDTNYGTQNFGKADVGRLKTQQIRANIFRRIGVNVESLPKKLTRQNARNFVRRFDLVVDLFDNAESRTILQEVCKSEDKACLHAGVAAMGFFEVRWNDTYVIPVPEKQVVGNEPCEYPLAANLVIMCVGVIAEIINKFVTTGLKRSAEFWLKSMSLEIFDENL